MSLVRASISVTTFVADWAKPEPAIAPRMKRNVYCMVANRRFDRSIGEGMPDGMGWELNGMTANGCSDRVGDESPFYRRADSWSNDGASYSARVWS